MNITPSTDLTEVIGRPVSVKFQSNGSLHALDGTITELFHGATSTRPEFKLEDGVRGHGRFTHNGTVHSSWFYWPYDGLTLDLAA